IVCAANGNQGITEATTLIPDLVISDIKMPETSGIELCNRLKEDEKTSHIPIILLTAYKSREYKIEGLQKGADAYLSKPFNIDELDIQITNLLQIRKKLKEKYCRQIMLEPANVEIEDIDEKFIQRVLKIVEQHMADSQFNAEVLSKEIGMSRMQLYRKIRGLTNLTVHEFIRTIRLKRATELLKEKRMTI
ncbi:MAG: response regulator, partial [Calditrichaeota bacterium]|nr:response regulator [Calditrichota bacterium]